MTTTLSWFLFMFLSFQLAAQSLFSDFTAQQFGDSVFIKWTLKAGNTCFDMQVERSADNILFEEIYTVPGLCGASEDLKYEFYDTELEGGLYYYRITGSSGIYISDTTEVNFIAVSGEDFVLYPNPTNSFIQLGISQALSVPFLIELYDAQGITIYSVVVNSRQHSIPAENLHTGYYFAKVTDDKGYSTSQKVLVL